MSDEKFSHVRLRFNKDTQHFYCDVYSQDETIILDLGPDIEDVKKVIKLLKEEFGGVQVPPGFMN